MCHVCMNYIVNVCLKLVTLSILTFFYTDVIVITDLTTLVSVYDTIKYLTQTAVDAFKFTSCCMFTS